MKPVAEVAELDLRQASPEQVGHGARRRRRGRGPSHRGRARSAAPRSRPAARRPPTRTCPTLGPLARRIADPAVVEAHARRQGARTSHHGRGRRARRRDVRHADRRVPARPGHDRLRPRAPSASATSAPTCSPGSTRATAGSCSTRTRGDAPPPTAATVGLLVPVMEEQIDKQGCDRCWTTSSCRCRPCSRGWRLAASASTSVPRRDGRGRPRPDGAPARPRSTSMAGREFNLNSPPQLREVLYGELGLQPGKKTPKGELSTDASVLEKLRDEHPIVDALLVVARARQAELHVPRGAAEARRRATGGSTRPSTRPRRPPAG